MKLLLLFSLSTVGAVVAAQAASTATFAHAAQTRPTLLSTTTQLPIGYFTTTKYIVIDGVTNDHVTLPAKTIEIAIPTCVQTEIPDKNGHVPPGTCGSLWAYYPSFAAAVVFAVLFLSLLVLHVWQAARHRKVNMYHLRAYSSDLVVLEPETRVIYRHGAGSLLWLACGRHWLSLFEPLAPRINRTLALFYVSRFSFSWHLYVSTCCPLSYLVAAK